VGNILLLFHLRYYKKQKEILPPQFQDRKPPFSVSTRKLFASD